MRTNSLGIRRLVPVSAVLAVAALLAVFVIQSGQSTPAYAQDACVIPGSPQNFQATAAHAKLTLTWDEPTSWGGWEEGGRRYYTLHWRRVGSGWAWNVIGNSWDRNPPTAAYTFSGRYRESRGGGPSGDHAVTNGIAYEFQIQAHYATIACGHIGSYEVETSGTPEASQVTLSDDATLSGLELQNATFGSTRSEAPVGLLGRFSSDIVEYYAFVLKDITRVTVKPTATTGNDATITVRRQGGRAAHNVASGASSSALEIPVKSDLSVPHVINVKVIAEDGVATLTYRIRVWQLEPISFGDAAVDDMHFTAGAEVPNFSSGKYSGNQILVLALPGVEGVRSVTYTATGLPAGLYLGDDRVIRGTPEAATTAPVTVTYTVSDADTGTSDSLTFQATVAQPVAFAEEDLKTYYGEVITYTAGQAAPLTVTLPEATGGTGTLAYELLFNRDTDTVTADVPGAGVSLDPSTRVLTIDGNSNVNRIPLKDVGYAITYRAKDENGGTASAESSISVIGPPTLSEISDKTYTAGRAVSLTLPAASGPWWKLVPRLSYKLEPVVTIELMNDGVVSRTVEVLDMEGMEFNTGSRLLSGTPQFAGSTEMTYTATDGNGVSTQKTFTITVVNGPNAPTSAPTSLQLDARPLGSNTGLIWGAVTGATEYVVQVIDDGGSYPAEPVNYVPTADAHLGLSGSMTVASIWLTRGGDYKVRVAARNADGVGPWSAEASFTVKVGGM